MKKNILKKLGMEEEFKEWLDSRPKFLYPPIKVLKKNSTSERILGKLWEKDRVFEGASVSSGEIRPLDTYNFNQRLHELRGAGLVEKPSRGKYKITSKGIKAYQRLRTHNISWVNPDTLEKPKPKSMEYDRYSAPTNIVRSGTQKWYILAHLSTFGKMRFSDLGEQCHCEPQNLNMYLKRMEAGGLIDRPGRGIYRLTDKGEEVLKEVYARGVWRR